MNILVVGGAGYIGSHCVRQLLSAGHNPIVLDNLSYGHKAAIQNTVQFYQENLGNQTAVKEILIKEHIDIVMHFAAYISVGESVDKPIKYYQNNVAATINLLEAMLEVGVKKFIFSSTCAIYGNTDQLPLIENTPTHPINPYSQSKLDIEILLRYLAKSNGLSSSVLRYFNAAGASETGEIGQSHQSRALIPLVLKAAIKGESSALQIFGDDYPTADGTCLRDYIHVDDLIRAHIASLPLLEKEGQFIDYNLGTGSPVSVKEIITTAEQITGFKVHYTVAPRRKEDIVTIYADNSKAKQELNWIPECSDITTIIKTAWNWHSKNLKY